MKSLSEISTASSLKKNTILDSIFKSVIQDVTIKFSSKTAHKAFEDYSTKLNTLVSPYVVNGFLDSDAMTARYLAELAVLHITVVAITHWCALRKIARPQLFFDFNLEAIYFSWYQIPTSLQNLVTDWVVDNSELMDGGEWIETLSNNYLTNFRRRELGEFYTPNWVANHMIDISGLNSKLPQAICDPACGNGNLLGNVLLRLLKLKKIGNNVEELIDYLNNNIYGFDVQPIAILLTRLRLISIVLSTDVIEEFGKNRNPFQVFSLNNIMLTDPLLEKCKLWDDPVFDYMIGNPPFLKIRKEQIPYYGTYSDVIAGQPNLYQFFLWWAIKAAKPNSSLTFVTPLSVKSGQYLSKFRKGITKHCDIKSFTLIQNRKGTFVNVDQQVLIISLKKADKPDLSRKVTIRVKTGSDDINQLKKLVVEQKEVILDQKDSALWFLSNNKIDYTILAKVLDGAVKIQSSDTLKVENGGFVWNQNNKILSSALVQGYLPLISSPSIASYRFKFPSNDKRVVERNFAKEVLDKQIKVHTTFAVFIKRTTPEKDIGRRIIATLSPKDFLSNYPSYYAENHVNLIKLSKPVIDSSMLFGIAAWLNSKLANFIFSMVNGSAHLSKFELDNMPISQNLLSNLACYSSRIFSNGRPDIKVIEEIDEEIYLYFKINKEQRTRIDLLIPSIRIDS